MYMLLSWLRFPIIFILRSMSLFSGIAFFGTMLLQNAKFRELLQILMLVTSFSTYALAAQYDRLLDRLERRSNKD